MHSEQCKPILHTEHENSQPPTLRGVPLALRDGAWVVDPSRLRRPSWWHDDPSEVAPWEVPPGVTIMGGEFGARCRCGGRLIWRGAWWCEDGFCRRLALAGYAGELPRALPEGAAAGAPVFRSLSGSNCDSEGGRGDAGAEWLTDVEWLTSWSRKTRSARFLYRGSQFGQVSRWHQDRMRGVAERVQRVRECGSETGLEWVEKDGKGRMPHRTACGCWRLCKRCVIRRRRKLSEGVTTQRLLALATHRKRMARRYAGREGRWTERMMTFTVRHKELASDVAVLPAAWRRLEVPWRRHLKMRGADMPQVYVRAIEVAGAGHAHLHVWSIGPYIEYSLLRAWWGAALEKEGYSVDRKPLAAVLRAARDKRTAEWLAPYVDADGCVPWPVLDVQTAKATAAGAARYVVKVGGAAALYVSKQEGFRDLEPVHAARVYEALEGVRAVQWARGWAPKRNASGRWCLRRISQVATADSSTPMAPDHDGPVRSDMDKVTVLADAWPHSARDG